MLNCFESWRLQLLPSTSQITPFQAALKRRAFKLQQETTSTPDIGLCKFFIFITPVKVLMLFVDKKLSVPLFPKSHSHINNVPKYLGCSSHVLEKISARS